MYKPHLLLLILLILLLLLLLLLLWLLLLIRQPRLYQQMSIWEKRRRGRWTTCALNWATRPTTLKEPRPTESSPAAILKTESRRRGRRRSRRGNEQLRSTTMKLICPWGLETTWPWKSVGPRPKPWPNESNSNLNGCSRSFKNVKRTEQAELTQFFRVNPFLTCVYKVLWNEIYIYLRHCSNQWVVF